MRRSTTTLRGRVVRSTALVSAVAMAAMVVTVMLVLSAISHSTARARLDDQLAAVSATLTVDGQGAVTELATPDDSIDDTTWIYDQDGRLLVGPRVGRRVQAQADALRTSSARTMVEEQDRLYLAAPVDVAGRGSPRAVVVVSSSLRPYEETRAAVLVGLSGVAVLVTLGSAAVAAWTLRRALAPVESMAERAADWSEHDLDARFDIAEADDEIARLALTLNLLLDRVDGALQAEQRLTSELAHELRTPLTAIRGEVELARMSASSPAAVERLDRVVGLVDRMTAVITTLVDLARGHAGPQARSALDDVVHGAAAQQPVDRSIEVFVSCPPGIVLAAPAEIVVRAVAPLLDNAVDFAATAVRVTAVTHDRFVEVAVSDDGPGIDPAVLGTLFVAGRRGPDSAGAGLGLALSRRIARSLGGDVEVTSERGPTTVTLTLPRF